MTDRKYLPEWAKHIESYYQPTPNTDRLLTALDIAMAVLYDHDVQYETSKAEDAIEAIKALGSKE